MDLSDGRRIVGEGEIDLASRSWKGTIFQIGKQILDSREERRAGKSARLFSSQRQVVGLQGLQPEDAESCFPGNRYLHAKVLR
jgi:hypothetical protein